MDYNIIFLIVGIVVAVAGIVGTNIWSNKQRTDRLAERKTVQQMELEKTAREKQKEEQNLAREVERENKARALDVKQDMINYVDRSISDVKKDIELSRVPLYSRLADLEGKTVQIKDELKRMQKAIDFFQTMQYGPDAKSIPPYITGEEATAEHKAEPEKGVFASRADTTHEDTKDPE